MRAAIGSLVLLSTCLLAVAVPGQRPDEPLRKGLTRQQLEAAFLGGAPAVESIEANAQVFRIADLRRNESGEDVGARMAMERFVLQVLRQELERKGAWLDDKAYAEAYAAYADRYDRTPFTVKVLATRFKGYPSLEAFQQRWRVQECFRRTLPKEAFDDAALAKEALASNDLLVGNGVEIDLWMHPAPPQDDGRFDFAAAEAAAGATIAARRAGKEPETPGQRFGDKVPLQWNPLQEVLGEGEFATLLREPVAATVMRAKEGDVLGPLRGSKGALVVEVRKLTKVDRTVDLAQARQRDLVRQLLEQRLFLAWVDQVFATAVLRVPRR
ncbi:MAG: hypothetical protein JNK15_17235 [Planctomycetes bacterium]|nr:hypothetical protein [Planctomycetota bacterium]